MSTASHRRVGSPPQPTGLARGVRVALGVKGSQQTRGYWSEAGAQSRACVRGLAGLAFADALPSVLLWLLVSWVAPDLGASSGWLRTWLLAGGVAVAAAALMSLRLARSGRRLTTAVWVATNAGLVVVVVAQLEVLTAAAALLVLRAALLGVGAVTQRPLVVDVSPPEVRVRALARWRGAGVLGGATAAGLAAAVVGGPEWGWRSALSAAGAVAAVLGLVAAFVDDPGVGGVERRRLVGLVGEEAAPVAVLDRPLRSLDRVAGQPTVALALVGYLAVGVAGLAPVTAIVGLVRTSGTSAVETCAGLAIAWSAAAVVTVLAARGLEARGRRGPRHLAAAVPVLLVVSVVGLVAISWMHQAAAALVGTAVVATGAALAIVVLDATALSAVDPADRPAVAALSTLAVVSGVVLGLVWLAVLGEWAESRFTLASLGVLVVVLAIPTVWLSTAAEGALGERVDRIVRDARLHPAAPNLPRWARPVVLAPDWPPALPAVLQPPPPGFVRTHGVAGTAGGRELVARLIQMPQVDLLPVADSARIDPLTSPLDQLPGRS
ncbi:MAG TPA: MFS transporter [Candidatus Limnocylindria bacterium]|nr:MFS transporter [Candidatus Limnocylindria bacterium]